MKNLIFIYSILIILFKTGNVLSDSKIFNVNNIEISKENYKNNENLVNQAFKIGFTKLIERLLLDDDYKRVSNTSLEQIKKLISYYQITDPDEKNNKKIKVNLFFEKDNIHNFFYNQNILYSDIINAEVVLFPLLINKKEYFFYTNNYFYSNWNFINSNDLIEYNLPLENIENFQKIELNKNNIFNLDIADFFKEYNKNNIVFAIIEIKNNEAKIFLKTKIFKKKINKTLSINKGQLDEIDFNKKIILEIKKELRDLIKSQNLIDVRTPSFLNVKIKLNDKNNLIEFKNRIQKIGLIDDYYVQLLNKDFILIKIKYLGKINKIIKSLEEQNIELKMNQGQWQLVII